MSKPNNRKKQIALEKEIKVEEYHDFVVEFRAYKTELTEKFRNRTKWVPADKSKVKSFIPGTITKFFVEEGDKVDAGQELMILEAMKMQNLVFAEVSGIVKKINAVLGEQVPKGKVIFEFDITEN